MSGWKDQLQEKELLRKVKFAEDNLHKTGKDVNRFHYISHF